MSKRSWLGRALVGTLATACGGLIACGSDAVPPSAAQGGAGVATAGSSGGAVTAAGSPGASGSGTDPSSGGAATVAGGGATASNDPGGAGTAGTDSNAGAGGTAGIRGTAGTSAGGGAGTAGQGGSAGGSSDDASAAAVLNRYQLLDPCQSSYNAKSTPGDVCPQDTAVKNQHNSLQFGGDAAVTYQVTLRVRGIMEGYWYTGGTLDPTSKTFYTGGVPTVGGFSSACKNKTSELPFTLPSQVAPTDNCWNGFNMFAMTVSQPSSHYYLNYTAQKNGDRPPHAVYNSDYTVTIPIKGQAKIEFYIVGSDEHECYNFSQVVNGVSLKPSPYIGEFVQFDVMNVTRAP